MISKAKKPLILLKRYNIIAFSPFLSCFNPANKRIARIRMTEAENIKLYILLVLSADLKNISLHKSFIIISISMVLVNKWGGTSH